MLTPGKNESSLGKIAGRSRVVRARWCVRVVADKGWANRPCSSCISLHMIMGQTSTATTGMLATESHAPKRPAGKKTIPAAAGPVRAVSAEEANALLRECFSRMLPRLHKAIEEAVAGAANLFDSQGQGDG